MSSNLVRNAELCDILGDNTLLTGKVRDVWLRVVFNQRLVQDQQEYNAVLAAKEAVLIDRIKRDRSLHRSEVIFDTRMIRFVALLQRSLELVKTRLYSCGQIGDQEFPRATLKEGRNGLIYTVYDDGQSSSQLEFTKTFQEYYWAFMAALTQLCNTCLYLLHIEVRVHAFYYLDLAFREGNYLLDEPVQEPDPYINSLVGDLIELDSTLAEWLPISKYLFVFDGLAKTFEGILLTNFRCIKGINLNGRHKLEQNLLALESVLATISPSSSSSGGGNKLEKVREYYLLSMMSADRLFDYISSQPVGRRHSFLQYQALLEFIYKDTMGDPAKKKEFQNQLVKLEYVFEEKAKK